MSKAVPSPKNDMYFVAVKLLLRDNDKLLITHDIFGDWDLPGGRIRATEFMSPPEVTIMRKMNEELGGDVKFTLGEPKAFFRVERAEHNLHGQLVRIFAVGYEAIYTGGKITLGKHHDKFEWVEVNTFKPEAYFIGGWLVGVNEYINKIRI